MHLDDPEDLHEWVSFDDDGATYVFDVTFLTSNWTCIFGDGCLGVLTEPAPELGQGCCTYGAHFTDKEDRKQAERYAERLTDDQWQFKAEAERARRPDPQERRRRLGEPRWSTTPASSSTAPGSTAGPGCALHAAALDAGERPLDWKPEVCWQLPLRLDHHVDDNGHSPTRCASGSAATGARAARSSTGGAPRPTRRSSAAKPVYETLRDEIIELVGDEPYDCCAATSTHAGHRDPPAPPRRPPRSPRRIPR